MALQNSQYDALMRYYQRLQFRNKHEQDARIAEAQARIPRLALIDQEIAAISVKKARILLGDKNATDFDLNEQIQTLSRERTDLLKANGYPEDYLKMHYTCPLCQDTGYVNGKRCHCFERQRLNILYAQSNIEAVLKEENFDHLRFDFYDDTEKVPQLGMTERAYMDVVVRQCREFAQQYPDKGNSILFTGGTGVGKTFLTNCIAKALIDRCISVIYLSSNELFEIFSKYKFGRDGEEDVEESYRYILDCDMLIIDDLGTELNNSFVSSQLFYCINERIGRKKGTIISTNLSMGMLKDTYSDRVTSRIMSNYRVIPLYGADIRMKKRAARL